MARTFNVTSLAELNTALSNASGGDIILLAGGNYGNAQLFDTAQTDLTFDAAVTIKSADPDNPAVFTGMDVRDASNIAVEGVVFDYVFAPGDLIYKQKFIFSGCEGLTLRGNSFDGDVAQGVSATDDGYGFGYGLVVRNSDNVVIADNEMQGFWNAISLSSGNNITVTGNDIHDIRSDGMQFAAVTDVRIEDNNIHDFRASLGSGDHRDMIQFWTSGTTTPSIDIIIRGNTLDIGEGDFTQSIFMRNEQVDEGVFGQVMFYRNILIEENVIVNGQSHGITVGETAGLIIRNNTVLHADGAAIDGADDAVEVPSISVAVTSTGVIITQNLTAAINGYSGQSGWTVQNNVLVQDQDPLVANFYADVFIASTAQVVNGVHGFLLLPGTEADLLGAGAAPTNAPDADDLFAARFHITTVLGEGATRIFDANFSDIGGLPPGTVATWLFGDGTTASGLRVSHTYASGGIADIVLALHLADGTTVAATLQLGIEGPDVVALTAAGGFEAYDNGQAISLGVSAAGSTDGLQLGGSSAVATVSRFFLRDIPSCDEINIDLSLKADSIGASGEVFRLNGSFSATITPTGELLFSTSAVDGTFHDIRTTGAHLADLSSHNISIQFADGQIRVIIDGDVRGQGAFSGPLAWNGYQDLLFGSPWGPGNFNGDLTAFRIRTNASDYPDTPHTEILQGMEAAELVLTGGSGDDVYTIRTANVRIEDEGGTDEVGSSILSIDLTAAKFDDVENIRQSGSADINLSGDEGANLLAGNAGDNVVIGRAGNDTLVGGAGIDTLMGGDGNDTYLVSSIQDRVIETGTGTDTVVTAITYTLATNIENATLTGTAQALTGNALNNILIGNASNNHLDGRGGADRMVGGAGNDTYVFNHLGDRIVETGTGTDTVLAAITYTLNAGIENATLTGTARGLTGNRLDNILIGNASDNHLDGMGGADRMVGGNGNDTYVINHRDDRVVENGTGIDKVFSSFSYTLNAGIENATLTGTARSLTGNRLDNTLIGNASGNRLDGMAGDDRMVGGAGTDVFIFHMGHDRDTIRDFDARGADHDTLDLRDLRSITSFRDLVAHHMHQSGDTTVITTGAGDVIRLLHVNMADLGSTDVLI